LYWLLNSIDTFIGPVFESGSSKDMLMDILVCKSYVEGAGMNNLPTGSLTSLGTFPFLQKVDFNDFCFFFFISKSASKKD